MEVINNYIGSLYKNDNSQEILELKEELKEHLIMSANEFINEGYEEQDAYEMAIKKFDGGSEMLKELYFTIKENKKEIKEIKKEIKQTNKVAKIISRISGVMCILCLITGTILTYHKTVNYIYEKPFTYWKQVDLNLSKELNKIIKDKDVKKDIDSYKDDISKLLSSSKFNKDVIVMRGYESAHKQIRETYEPSSILYTYGKDVTKDCMFTNGETAENDRGQKLYYTLKLTKPLYLKIYENTRVSAILATPIFFIIYVFLKIAF
ncbi:MAG: permease prefix domain 1-containing protein, partial [Romboutsia sp.]|uniref:permease prefix domain 1-containing protein n=1 Tax=Romboutsia sp. TaxID=1965302 RepID=UPI003F336C62